MRATRALIHLDNFIHNLKEIRKFSSDKKMCVAVKANAYGHGAVECARAAVAFGADFLAVATVEEGIELRENGITAPLLMLSLCDPLEIDDAVKNRITPLVFDSEYINLFDLSCSKFGVTDFAVHLAVDSGMGRIGCYAHEAGDVAQCIKSSKNLFLQGMCTHLCVSDEVSPESIQFTKKQKEVFLAAIENVRSRGIDPGICHCSNSAAALNLDDFHMDMVRPGIVCYGYYPGDLTRKYFEEKGVSIDLRPVMTLETKVSCIKSFCADQSVGYGRTWKACKNTRIAVLPIGYADGMLRSFSAAGIKVSIKGKQYPVRGRICMDQCMIDIGNDSNVSRWDTAVIFGDPRYGASITADDVANSIGTISYEITSIITKRVERVYLKS